MNEQLTILGSNRYVFPTNSAGQPLQKKTSPLDDVIIQVTSREGVGFDVPLSTLATWKNLSATPQGKLEVETEKKVAVEISSHVLGKLVLFFSKYAEALNEFEQMEARRIFESDLGSLEEAAEIYTLGDRLDIPVLRVVAIRSARNNYLEKIDKNNFHTFFEHMSDQMLTDKENEIPLAVRLNYIKILWDLIFHRIVDFKYFDKLDSMVDFYIQSFGLDALQMWFADEPPYVMLVYPLIEAVFDLKDGDQENEKIEDFEKVKFALTLLRWHAKNLYKESFVPTLAFTSIFRTKNNPVPPVNFSLLYSLFIIVSKMESIKQVYELFEIIEVHSSKVQCYPNKSSEELIASCSQATLLANNLLYGIIDNFINLQKIDDVIEIIKIWINLLIKLEGANFPYSETVILVLKENLKSIYDYNKYFAFVELIAKVSSLFPSDNKMQNRLLQMLEEDLSSKPIDIFFDLSTTYNKLLFHANRVSANSLCFFFPFLSLLNNASNLLKKKFPEGSLENQLKGFFQESLSKANPQILALCRLPLPRNEPIQVDPLDHQVELEVEPSPVDLDSGVEKVVELLRAKEKSKAMKGYRRLSNDYAKSKLRKEVAKKVLQELGIIPAIRFSMMMGKNKTKFLITTFTTAYEQLNFKEFLALREYVDRKNDLALSDAYLQSYIGILNRVNDFNSEIYIKHVCDLLIYIRSKIPCEKNINYLIKTFLMKVLKKPVPAILEVIDTFPFNKTGKNDLRSFILVAKLMCGSQEIIEVLKNKKYKELTPYLLASAIDVIIKNDLYLPKEISDLIFNFCIKKSRFIKRERNKKNSPYVNLMNFLVIECLRRNDKESLNILKKDVSLDESLEIISKLIERNNSIFTFRSNVGNNPATIQKRQLVLDVGKMLARAERTDLFHLAMSSSSDLFFNGFFDFLANNRTFDTEFIMRLSDHISNITLALHCAQKLFSCRDKVKEVLTKGTEPDVIEMSQEKEKEKIPD